MDREKFDFSKFKPNLLRANDTDSASTVHSTLATYLTDIHIELDSRQAKTTNEDLTYVLDQLDLLLDYFIQTFNDVTEIHHLTVDINRLIAKVYCLNISYMLRGAHEKFSIKLIDITSKMVDILTSGAKKISIKTNWYSSLKHQAVIILQSLFTKFNGFLNSYKNPLLTTLYKHLKKCHDYYNVSIENSIFRANYFTDLTVLTDIILANDNSRNTLDDRLFARLLRLSKCITQKNGNNVYTYPLLSVVHSYNFLVSILKSDRYLSTLTAKKSSSNFNNYLVSIASYTNELISVMDTDYKKLRLSSSKNLSDLLVFNYIVHGINLGESEKSFEYTINVIVSSYMKESSAMGIKTGLIETLTQFFSKLNLYHQTNSVSTGFKTGINFMSLKVFEVLNVIYYQTFAVGSLSKPFKISSKEEQPVQITSRSNMNDASLVLNHLEILYTFFLREVDCDINKLIILSKTIFGNSSDSNVIRFPSLVDAISSSEHEPENQWYIISLLKLVQLLIVDIDQYILSQQDGISDSHEDLATKMSVKLFQLCKHKSFKIRVAAVETLTELLKIKPELSFNILNSSFGTLMASFDEYQTNKNYAFNENHGLAFLISSNLSTCSKDFINSDFVLRVFSVTTNFLKKFNSTVITSNLFGSGSGSYISNTSYEKQLISWIMLMGLFNFAIDENGSSNSNFFLLESTQFINIWNNLLAHSIPSNFVQFEANEDGVSKVTNMNEIMKLVEVKNLSLACLLSYVTYLSSTKSSTVLHTHDTQSKSSLLTPEIARQLNQIITKSFTFINILKSQVSGVTKVPAILDTAITMNKLRIYQNFIKLLPYLNIKNEVNSSLFLEVVHNFSDSKIYTYEPDAYQQIKKSSKKKKETTEIQEYQIYKVGDGINFGLTSKIGMFKIDELMVKSTGFKGKNIQQKNTEHEIDILPLHDLFSVESPFIKSNFAPVYVFDDPLEAMCLETIQHSFLNDYLMFLYNGNSKLGYTDRKKYPVNTETMIIDISIEIFAITFPYMTLKVQQSIIESMRTSIFFKAKESKESNLNNIVTDDTSAGEILRKRAITINSSVAIHGALSYMNNHNSHMQHSNAHSKLSIPKVISSLLIETLKNVDSQDRFISILNAESIGLCCSLVDENREEMLSNQVSNIVKSIVDNSDPDSRSFDCQALSKIAQYSNLMNTSPILNVLFTLLGDPHPTVHAASMDSLTTLISSQPQVELNGQVLKRILKSLECSWFKDDYGIYSPITIASNMNYISYSNSCLVLAKMARVIINTAGPMIKIWEEQDKTVLRNLIFGLMNLVTNDFELIARELMKALEELVVFDKNFIPVEKYIQFIKFIMVNNFKVGVYGNSLSSLPLDDDDNDTTSAVFPNTTSDVNWRLSLDSCYQLIKLHPEGSDVIDDDIKGLLWIALEKDPENDSIKDIFINWLDNSINNKPDEKFVWFGKLLEFLNMPKLKLYDPLFGIYKKRINNGGMFFSLARSNNMTDNYKMTSTTSPTPRSDNNQPSMQLDDEGETFANVDDDVGLKSEGGNEPAPTRMDNDMTEDNSKIILESNLVQLMVLENEPTNWKFKLFIIELLIQLLSYSHNDSKLKMYLSTKIPEFVKVAFTCSSSSLIKLRIASLNLLGDIIGIYGDMTDPLYPELSILDQQQAQIITAIVPAFDKDSTIDLAGAAMVLASKLVSSNVTHISRMSRVVKILTSSLESFATLNNNKGDPDSHGNDQKSLKIGDISVMTKKSQNKIKVHILQAWARIRIHCSPDDLELQALTNKYIDILVPLWMYSLRDFAMLKYGSDFMSGSSDDVEVTTYEECWADFVEVVGMIADEDPNQFKELLGDDLGNFFFVLFGQCIEYLIKTSSKQNAVMTKKDTKILKSLQRILKLNGAMEVLFKESIFIEFIDLLDRLVTTSDASFKTSIIKLSATAFEQYFNTASSSDKSPDQLHGDADKLFELLRVNMLAIIKILPFVRDREVNIDKMNILIGSDLILLKKSYDMMIEMIGYLPDVIKVDLYSCILYSFTLIYELNNGEVIAVLLPTLKRAIASLNSIDPHAKSLVEFYGAIKKFLKPDNNNSLLTIFILVTTVPNMRLSDNECDDVAEFITSGLVASDNNLIAFSTQTVKTLIKLSTSDKGYSSLILVKLIPKLIKLLTAEDIELKEPRLILEILVTLTKSLQTDESILSSMKLSIPVLLWFNDYKQDQFKDYIHGKLVELLKFSPNNFKTFIETSCGDEQKSKIESLVKYDPGSDGSGGMETFEATVDGNAHIQLKTFG